MTSILEQVDAQTRGTLEQYGFDERRFVDLQERVAAGLLSPETNAVRGRVEPPLPGDVTPLPAPGEPAWAEAREAGLEVLRAGAAAPVVLNGGMATRFGGVVKGIVEALEGRSFLELKLGETERLGRELGVELPAAVMTSFATDLPTRVFVAERGLPEPVFFSQFVSLRLEPDGNLFRDDRGAVSLYSPGHGDFLRAFPLSGALAELRERGVRHVMVSNVDNLAARLDPVVLGAHVLAGRPMTSEVVQRAGDAGGAPARVDGRLMLLEDPRFPPGFDRERIPVFNVNTVTFDIDVLERDYDLTWLYVEKEVEGRRAVQLEHVYHEAANFLPATYLQVPRTGPRGRFLPVKAPADLETVRPQLRELLAASPLD